ncbi:isoflavone reductase family protein [Boeremia exigua]|uniref:isoflavone reductase family protein n=1 Tax=Boeremia exigua TaxID=749465 RepID=UPI001E8CAC5F|nr:isoflavone reductase family protein [Boeremia exigua]KAH6644387.1 isoflavone reductase family protein [Boeremia exigua]
MELKNIAILGPGGNVGGAIINELAKDGPKFNITAITRPTSTYTPADCPNIVHKTTDYSSLSSLTEAFTGQDAIVNCITGGATQYEPSKLIIDAAIAAGVKFYFANEFVSYVDSPQYRRMPEAFIGSKVRIRASLSELAAAGKISWTSLNGGPFFDMWLMKGVAGIDIANRRARIYGTGNNPLLWTPLRVIALAAGNMLRNPDAVANRPIYICPLAEAGLTQRSLLATLERMLNTTFTVEQVDVAEINKNSRIALEKGEPGKAMKGLAISNQFYEEDSGNDFSHLIENDVVGVDLMTVEDAVDEAIAKWGQDCPVVESMYNVKACEV